MQEEERITVPENQNNVNNTKKESQVSQG